MTTFAEATALDPREVDEGRGEFAAVLPEDWVQGRTSFGGLTGALMVRAAERVTAAQGWPFHSFDVAFIGPLPPGPATVRARILRQGKYVTHVGASIRGEGADEPAATAHMVMGLRRASEIAVPAAAPLDRPPLDPSRRLPYLPGVTPTVTQHLQYVYAGDYPFTGSPIARVAGYCRHATPASGAAALVALVDGWPAPVLPLLRAPAPASSVRWSMHWPSDEPTDGHEWLWYEADTVWASGGYGTCVARLWREDVLVAWSEQLVTVFDSGSPAAPAGTG